MGREIERKFLVTGDDWRASSRGFRIRQGYLCSDRKRTVRVRIAGDEAFLTVKGEWEGISRAEFEYPIPPADAAEMLDGLCDGPLIEKTRYVCSANGQEWTIDVFEGSNAGLVIAEVELADEDQRINPPAWIGAEVTFDSRYLNANLGQHPYSVWSRAERSAAQP